MQFTGGRGVARRQSDLTGLRNLGNTCYLNSVVQVMTFCPMIRDLIINSTGGLHGFGPCSGYGPRPRQPCGVCIIQEVAESLLTSGDACVTPTKLIDNLNVFSKDLVKGHQQDCVEAYHAVLDAMERDSRHGLNLHGIPGEGWACMASMVRVGGDKALMMLTSILLRIFREAADAHPGHL